MIIDVFSNQTLQELTDCLFWFIQIKIANQKVIRLEVLLTKRYVNNCNITVNEKNFHDQIVDANIKRHENIRKLRLR